MFRRKGELETGATCWCKAPVCLSRQPGSDHGFLPASTSFQNSAASFSLIVCSVWSERNGA